MRKRIVEAFAPGKQKSLMTLPKLSFALAAAVCLSGCNKSEPTNADVAATNAVIAPATSKKISTNESENTSDNKMITTASGLKYQILKR